MSDGRIEYEVRASTEQLDSDLHNANAKASASLDKLEGISAKTAAAIGAAFLSTGASAVKLGEDIDLLSEKAGRFASVAGTWETLALFMTFLWGETGELLKKQWDSITEHIESSNRRIGETTRGGLGLLLDFIKYSFTGQWSSAWENVKGIFVRVFEQIGAFFKVPINAVIDEINSFIRGVNSIRVPDWVPGIGGNGFSMSEIPKLKKGMDFVPYDEFPAFLHKGEAVLTAGEAEVLRAAGGIEALTGGMIPVGGAAWLSRTETIHEYGNLFGKAADYFIVREEADIDRIAEALYRKVRQAERCTGGGLY